MKTLSAKDAKYGSGRLINLARAEPVVIAKQGVLSLRWWRWRSSNGWQVWCGVMNLLWAPMRICVMKTVAVRQTRPRGRVQR